MSDHLKLKAPLAPKDAVAALIVLDDGRYLMQQRDDVPGIFYPGYWGLFGGAIEPGESAVEALAREVHEELAFQVEGQRYFTKVVFDFDFAGIGALDRLFFEVDMPVSALAHLKLGEGRAFDTFNPDQILAEPRVVPYDAFALWQHINRDFITA